MDQYGGTRRKSVAGGGCGVSGSEELECHHRSSDEGQCEYKHGGGRRKPGGVRGDRVGQGLCDGHGSEQGHGPQGGGMGGASPVWAPPAVVNWLPGRDLCGADVAAAVPLTGAVKEGGAAVAGVGDGRKVRTFRRNSGGGQAGTVEFGQEGGPSARAASVPVGIVCGGDRGQRCQGG